MTPALLNTSAAIARLMLDGLATEAIRMMQVTIRAIQNPTSGMLEQASKIYRTWEILTKYDHRHDEFVTSTSIELKNGHVYDCSDDEEEEEDGSDRNIGSLGREASK